MREKRIEELEGLGIVMLPKRKLKRLGWVCIGLGLLTIPIPLTTIPLIAVGVSFLGVSKYYVLSECRRKFRVWFRREWVIPFWELVGDLQ